MAGENDGKGKGTGEGAGDGKGTGTGTGASTTPGAADGGGTGPAGKKLIAGKYATLEEAVEQGYKGLEEGFHATRQEVAEVKETLQQMLGVLENTIQAGDPNRAAAVDGRGAGNAGGRYTAADFISDPEKILAERDDKLYNKFASLLTDTMSNMLDAQDYKSSNADLAGHERLVRSFLDESDSKKPLKDRLAEAGKKAREYIGQLRGGKDEGAEGKGERTNLPYVPNAHVEDVSTLGLSAAHYARAGEGPDAGSFEVLTPRKRLENLNDYIKDRLVTRLKMT